MAPRNAAPLCKYKETRQLVLIEAASPAEIYNVATGTPHGSKPYTCNSPLKSSRSPGFTAEGGKRREETHADNLRLSLSQILTD